MKHQLAVLSLWLIPVVATFAIIDDARVLTTLGPVYAVCMIGSIVTVRSAGRRPA